MKTIIYPPGKREKELYNWGMPGHRGSGTVSSWDGAVATKAASHSVFFLKKALLFQYHIISMHKAGSATSITLAMESLNPWFVKIISGSSPSKNTKPFASLVCYYIYHKT